MSTDDAQARKRRADALHRQIERLRQGPPAPAAPPTDAAADLAATPPGRAATESANQFVHRRMRELASRPPATDAAPTAPPAAPTPGKKRR